MTATVFVIRAMSRNPDLSVMSDKSEKDEADAIQDEEDEEEEEEDDDEGEDDEEDEEGENDYDIGEAAVPVPVKILAAHTPVISKSNKVDKSESKMLTPNETSAASDTHTILGSKLSAPSGPPSSSKVKNNTSNGAVKGKSKLDNDYVGDGELEGKVEEETVDGCRWVMQRLKGLGSDPRGRKRLHVIRVCTYMLILIYLSHLS